ncbi:MAG: YggS family pyridoxal phosphate-dependent enzyme [Candidatus Eisenbacteria bacterium]|nr:YggS family pyridoxal phosphate-dependent enzyme [Candidatus Eisenbacteria bacterium]
MPAIAENLRLVRERIAAAATRAGRDPEGILLLAVSKRIPAESVNEAIRAGVRAIGENRVQEAEAKWPALITGPERHLVGRLQRNKAGKAVELFDRIQSIDSLRLAEAVSRRSEAIGRRTPILLEVNISGEASKAGVTPAVLRDLAAGVAPLPGLLLEGLMTIGPLTGDEGAIRDAFRRMRGLFEDLRDRPVPGARMEILSMGMSDDFEIAVEEGTTLVRVGTAIFGPRPPA